MSLESQRAYIPPAPAELDDLRRLKSLHPCRVLVVDDDDLVRSRVSALLRASNYEVEVAASGEEALRVLSAKHCHIVVTDWEMPDMNGLALCRCVRISEEDGYVYVLMLTVRDTKADMLASFAAGADDYIVKGAPINEILARLEVGRRIVYAERSLRANRGNSHLALTDSLTGAHNLRYFIKHLSRELARSRRYAHSLAVLRCEIPQFAQVRDQYGHESAAEVLRAFLSRSEACIRTSSDWIARVGVGEFMIVLPETGARGACRVADKLQLVFGAESAATGAGPVSLKVHIATIAMDGAAGPHNGARIEELIRSVARGFHDKKTAEAGQEAKAAAAKVKDPQTRTRRNHGLN